MNITKENLPIFIKARGGKYRWLTVSTLLLAIGTILHLVSPSIAGITPGWMIATYVAAILLLKPSYRKCAGICLVAALLEVFTSKSAFPYGDFPAELAGGYVAAFIVHVLPELKIKKFDLKPALAGFFATVVSGGVFVSILVSVMGIPINVLLYAMLPMVVSVGIANAIITPFIYIPAKNFFDMRISKSSKEIVEKNHEGLVFKQSNEGIISLEHTYYSYLSDEHYAIKDINLSIQKGEFIVITGESGSGKSTLLMTMIGAAPNYFGGTLKGMCFTLGKAITQSSVSELSENIGVILEDYQSQFVTMTVEEEMAFTLENRGYDYEEIRNRIKETLKEVGLSGMEKSAVNTLSGGQKQRLILATVLVTNPEVLIMDSPASAMDPEGVSAFYEMVGRLNRTRNITVIIAEHDLSSVMPYASRFVLMEKGEIAKDGTPKEVIEYMYNNGIYEEAIPPLSLVQLKLEQKGFNINKPFTKIENAVLCVNELAGERR